MTDRNQHGVRILGPQAAIEPEPEKPAERKRSKPKTLVAPPPPPKRPEWMTDATYDRLVDLREQL